MNIVNSSIFHNILIILGLSIFNWIVNGTMIEKNKII